MKRKFKLNELAIKPEKFEGKNGEATHRIEDFEASTVANSWDNRTMVRYFSTSLTATARIRPLIHKNEARKQMKRMLEEDIIEASNSPWAAAYVLVKKMTGDRRLCIDFRKLNNCTKKNVYPLPNIEDCLEPLCGNMYFSQLDLASGYWQLKMADSSKKLTAF